MTIPHAWIPVLRSEPSTTRAVWTVCPSRLGCSATFLSCFTSSRPSLFSLSLSCLSENEKVFLRLRSGTSLAMRSASWRIQVHVCLIDDLAAIEP